MTDATGLRRRRLKEARQFVRRSYRDPDLSLRDLARELGISARHVQRLFADDGENFRAYLLRIRMEKAAELLGRRHNPLPILVVAHRVGYRHASGLRQAFVRFHGLNPSDVQPEPPQELYAEVNVLE